MVHLVKYLLCKPEDTGWEPQHTGEKSGRVARAYYPVTGEVEAARSLASMASLARAPGSGGDSVSATKVENNEKDTNIDL